MEGEVWNFSHLKFTQKHNKKKLLTFIIKKKQITSDLHLYSVCHMYAVVYKKSVIERLFVFSEIFLTWLVQTFSAFKYTHIESFFDTIKKKQITSDLHLYSICHMYAVVYKKSVIERLFVFVWNLFDFTCSKF